MKLKYLACAHVHSVISHFEMYLQVCLYAGEFAMFRFTDISVRLLFAGMLILQCVWCLALYLTIHLEAFFYNVIFSVCVWGDQCADDVCPCIIFSHCHIRVWNVQSAKWPRWVCVYFIPACPPCWVCCCVASWRRWTRPQRAGVAASHSQCWWHRRSRCDHHHS